MSARWLIVGLVSGALAVLVFHQAGIALLYQIGVLPRAPYSLAATAPFGVPQIVSITFWSALWGLVLAASLRRLSGARLVLAALVFGMVLPTLVAWLVVAPLKGQPLAAGGEPARMAIGIFVNGLWGLGTGIGLALFGRRPR
jgi:hypothetical protein